MPHIEIVTHLVIQNFIKVGKLNDNDNGFIEMFIMNDERKESICQAGDFLVKSFTKLC